MRPRSLLPLAGLGLALTGAAWLAGQQHATREARKWSRDVDSAMTQSIAFFERRLVKDPHNYLIAGKLATRYVTRFNTAADLQDVERAETLVRDVVRRSPNQAGALSKLSSILLMQHKFSQALEVATQAVSADSLDDGARGALFDAALASGRYAKAEAALFRLRAGELGTLVRRAQWATAIGSTETATQLLDRACRQLARGDHVGTSTAWCLTELARSELAANHVGAARHMFQTALTVRPGYRGAIEGLADLAHAEGDLDEARARYQSIATDAHPDLYLRLANIADEQGNEQASLEYRRRFLATAAAPEREALFGSMLATYYLIWDQPGGLDSAFALIQRDLTRRQTVENHDLLGAILLRQGDPTSALAASDRARQWGAPSPTMNYRRSQILRALGRDADADRLSPPLPAEFASLALDVQQSLRRAHGGH